MGILSEGDQLHGEGPYVSVVRGKTIRSMKYLNPLTVLWVPADPNRTLRVREVLNR